MRFFVCLLAGGVLVIAGTLLFFTESAGQALLHAPIKKSPDMAQIVIYGSRGKDFDFDRLGSLLSVLCRYTDIHILIQKESKPSVAETAHLGLGFSHLL